MENRNLFYTDVFYSFTATKYKYKIGTVVQKKKKETPLFISMQIIVEK